MPDFCEYLTTCWIGCFGLWSGVLRGDLSRHKKPQRVQALDTLAFLKDRTDGAVEQVHNCKKEYSVCCE